MFDQKIILFLKRDSLELYLTGFEGPKSKLAFPPEIVKYEEIIDEAKFENLVSTFLQKELASGQRITILLSPDVLFQKTILQKDNNSEEAETQKFAGEIPFDAAKTAQIKVTLADKIFLIATNKKLYLPIVASVQKLASQVEAVIPASLFGLNASLPLTKKDFSQIFKNNRLIDASDFLKIPTDTTPPTDNKDSNFFAKINKNILFVGIAILIIISILSLVFIKQKKQSDIPKKETEITTVSPVPTPAEEGTGGAEIGKTKKEDLKIQILNGTGIAGQAQDLADLLNADGFTNITLGNSAITDKTQATIGFKEQVVQKDKDNLIQKLEEIFETVQIETLQESDFDIEITTGKLKTP